MSYPVFATGDVLNASDMNAVGLWLVKSQAVGSTGVTSVSISQAFGPAFNNYKVIWSGGQTSAATNINVRIGLDGVYSTTGYYGSLIYHDRTAGVPAVAGDVNNSQFTWAAGGAGASDGAAAANFDILNPYNALRTEIHSAQVLYGAVYGNYIGLHDIGSSYNDLRLIVAGGNTMKNGTIYIYGYQK